MYLWGLNSSQSPFPQQKRAAVSCNPFLLLSEELKNVGHLTAIDKEGEALCAELRNFIDVDSDKIAEIKEMRDRAYTVATTMYEEAREGGKFIFRNNPERIAEYRNLTSK